MGWCALLAALKRKSLASQKLARLMVPWIGVEPTRPLGHTPLKRARLPIPPPGQVICRYEECSRIRASKGKGF